MPDDHHRPNMQVGESQNQSGVWTALGLQKVYGFRLLKMDSGMFEWLSFALETNLIYPKYFCDFKVGQKRKVLPQGQGVVQAHSWGPQACQMLIFHVVEMSIKQ